MKRQFLFAACTLFAASALLMTSCQQAEEPIANDPTDQAGPMTRAATLGNFYRVVYVEVNDVNPLNAGEYLLSDGTPFFTHVILFASNIRGDASGNVHNYNNPNNAAILANPSTYIAPLQAKGIKVIMGNLGDHTGAGFANLTAAQIGTYTDDLVAYDNVVSVSSTCRCRPIAFRRLTQQPRLSVKPLRTPERPTRKTMAINVLRKMRRNRL